MIRRPPTSPLFPYPTLFRSFDRHRQFLRRDVFDPFARELDRPLERRVRLVFGREVAGNVGVAPRQALRDKSLEDRKSTRLNSSHSQISYAVFCLKKTRPVTV